MTQDFWSDAVVMLEKRIEKWKEADAKMKALPEPALEPDPEPDPKLDPFVDFEARQKILKARQEKRQERIKYEKAASTDEKRLNEIHQLIKCLDDVRVAITPLDVPKNWEEINQLVTKAYNDEKKSSQIIEIKEEPSSKQIKSILKKKTHSSTHEKKPTRQVQFTEIKKEIDESSENAFSTSLQRPSVTFIPLQLQFLPDKNTIQVRKTWKEEIEKIANQILEQAGQIKILGMDLEKEKEKIRNIYKDFLISLGTFYEIEKDLQNVFLGKEYELEAFGKRDNALGDEFKNPFTDSQPIVMNQEDFWFNAVWMLNERIEKWKKAHDKWKEAHDKMKAAAEPDVEQKPLFGDISAESKAIKQRLKYEKYISTDQERLYEVRQLIGLRGRISSDAIMPLYVPKNLEEINQLIPTADDNKPVKSEYLDEISDDDDDDDNLFPISLENFLMVSPPVSFNALFWLDRIKIALGIIQELIILGKKHGDLKSKNVMVWLGQQNNRISLMPNTDKFSSGNDIWDFGNILIELIWNNPKLNLDKAITPPGCPSSIKPLIQACFNYGSITLVELEKQLLEMSKGLSLCPTLSFEKENQLLKISFPYKEEMTKVKFLLQNGFEDTTFFDEKTLGKIEKNYPELHKKMAGNKQAFWIENEEKNSNSLCFHTTGEGELIISSDSVIENLSEIFELKDFKKEATDDGLYHLRRLSTDFSKSMDLTYRRLNNNSDLMLDFTLNSVIPAHCINMISSYVGEKSLYSSSIQPLIEFAKNNPDKALRYLQSISGSKEDLYQFLNFIQGTYLEKDYLSWTIFYIVRLYTAHQIVSPLIAHLCNKDDLWVRYKAEKNIPTIDQTRIFSIYQCQDIHNKNKVLISFIVNDGKSSVAARSITAVLSQSGILSQKENPYILPILETGHYVKEDFVGLKQNIVYIIQPYEESLAERLKRHPSLELFSLKERLEITIRVVLGVLGCHAQEMSCGNISVHTTYFNDKGDPQLGDFGVSCRKNQPRDFEAVTVLGNCISNMARIPPEFLTGTTRMDCLSDIYSIGFLLYDVFALPEKKESKHRPRFPIVFPEFSSHAEMELLIQQCMEKEPKNRPSLLTILDQLRKMLYKLVAAKSQELECKSNLPFFKRPADFSIDADIPSRVMMGRQKF
jgi:hypothetical protein